MEESQEEERADCWWSSVEDPYRSRRQRRQAILEAGGKRLLASTIRNTESFNREVLAKRDHCRLRDVARAAGSRKHTRGDAQQVEEGGSVPVRNGVADNSAFEAEREYWRQRKVEAKVKKQERVEAIKRNSDALIAQYRREQGLVDSSKSLKSCKKEKKTKKTKKKRKSDKGRRKHSSKHKDKRKAGKKSKRKKKKRDSSDDDSTSTSTTSDGGAQRPKKKRPKKRREHRHSASESSPSESE